MAHTVRIMHYTGTPTTGIWCNACMTSGGITVPLNRLTQHGVTTMATGLWCTTCETAGDLQL